MNSLRKSILLTALACMPTLLMSMNTPLILACLREDWQTVNTMLSAMRNGDIQKQCNEFGATPLHLAIGTASYADKEKSDLALQTADTLIDAGVHIDAVNGFGLTPLMIAVLAQNPPIIKRLIAKGANPNLCPTGIFTNRLSAKQIARALLSLHAASPKGNMALSMDVLTAIDPFTPGVEIERSISLPHAAAPAAGAGAGAKATEDKGNGAIAYKAKACDAKECKNHVAVGGANKTTLDLSKPLYGPYHGKGKVYTSQELMQALNSKMLNPNLMYADNDTPPIVTAAEHNDRAVIQCLIDNGYEYIDEADAKGETALHKAAFADNMLLAHYLIMIKLEIDCPDNEGNTPLMTAVQKTKKNVASLLLCCGADVTKCNKKKESLLKQAVDTEYPYMVALLLEQKDVPLDKKTEGKTPFEWAQHKLKNLSAQEIAQGKGEGIDRIVILFQNYMTEMSDVVKTQLEKEEQAAADQEQAAKAKKQTELDEKAWIAWAKQEGRAQFHPILARRCGLALDRKAHKDSDKYMNPHDQNSSTLKILSIIDKQLGLAHTTKKK